MPQVDDAPHPPQPVTNPYYEDPTALTTAAVNAATEQWRRDLESTERIINTRLDGMDQATVLHSLKADEVTSRAERQLGHLKELLEDRITAAIRISDDANQVQVEKFASIQLQFTERDVRTDQAARTSADALAAALQAAKELVNVQSEASAAAAVKSETSFAKQLDQVTTIISTLEKALDARITEMKERLDRGEGQSAGADYNRVDSRAGLTLAIGITVGLFSLVSIIVAIYAVVKK